MKIITPSSHVSRLKSNQFYFILRLLKIKYIRVCHYKGKFLWLNTRQL